MKKLSIVLAAAWLVAACSPKEAIKPLPSRVFNASIEPGTRTYTDGTKVYWLAADGITLFDHGEEMEYFDYEGEEGATSGPFVSASGESYSPQTTLPYVYAYYPQYDYIEIWDAQTVYGYIDPGQVYSGDTFDTENGNPMVAVSEDENLAFKNLPGYLKIPLYGDSSVALSSVTIEGNGGEYLAGDILITVTPGADPVSVPYDEAGYASKTVTVSFDQDEGPVFLGSQPLDVWISLIPGIYADGITVSVTGVNNSVFSYSSSSPLTIKRGVCTSTSLLNVTFPDRLSKSVDEIYGTYQNSGESIYGTTYDEEPWTITVAASDDLSKGDALITSFYDFDCAIYADWDEESWTLSFGADNYLGGFLSGGYVYYFWTDAYNRNSDIALILAEDGNFSSGTNYPGYYYEYYEWPSSGNAADIDYESGDYDYNYFFPVFDKVSSGVVLSPGPKKAAALSVGTALEKPVSRATAGSPSLRSSKIKVK